VPDPPQRVVGHAHVGRVRHHHDSPIPRLDPELDQTAGQTAAALEQLAAAVPLPLEEQRLVVPMALERPLRKLRQVLLAHPVLLGSRTGTRYAGRTREVTR